MSNSIFIHLVYNSALLFPVVILYTSFSFKKFEETRLKQMIVGFLIALIGIVIMSNPMELSSGIFFDSRNILLGISAMFFPLISTLIAMVSMLLLRIFSGGDGMLTGVVNIITSVGIGLIWRALRHDVIVNSEKNHWAELLSVSVINHIFVFLSLFLLPKESMIFVIKSVAFSILLVYPITQYFLIMIILRTFKQERIMRKVKEGEHLFRTMFEQAPIGITLTDSTTGKIIDSNAQFQKMLGLSQKEAEKVDWMSLTHPDDISTDREHMKRLLDGEIQSFSMDKRFIRNDGKMMWTNISVSTLSSKFSSHTQHLCMVVDIHNRKEMEEQILYAYVHDHLTGLPNQFDFMNHLHTLMQQREFPFTIAIADVNGFKMINDAFSREAGDSLLLHIVQILQEEKDEEDYVARIGGDDFALIFKHDNEEKTNAFIQRIHKRIQMLSQHKVVVSLSFGVVVAHDDTLGVDDLLKKAENDLNQNKLHESPSTRSKALYTIIHTLHEKNPREELHSRRVSLLGARLAEAVGMGSKEIAQMKTVGLLHDIGKINIDQSILNKTGPLDTSEWEEMKKHPEKGYRIMMSVSELGELSRYVLSHHERIDGKGYPQGLKGDEIPLQSRIICIVDAFDAMTAWRPYKKMMKEEDAARELIKCSGTQFDAGLASIFVKQVLKIDIL